MHRVLFRMFLSGACAVLLLLACIPPASGGPPFRTDDPEPPEHKHWQLYAGVSYQTGKEESVGAAPFLEADYTFLPDFQLHAIVPNAFAKAKPGPTLFGLGNIELGVEYRFMHESDRVPMAGLFPLIEVPTGSRARGLGTGEPQFFLPLWFQKRSGRWTAFGGGGYWINPGEGNRNFWYTGLVLERDIGKRFTVGAEVFHLTPTTRDGESETGYNLGAIVSFNDAHHFICSAGSDIHGPARFFFYAAYLLTWGPSEKDAVRNEKNDPRPSGKAGGR
jgi:hypothetical protein